MLQDKTFRADSTVLDHDPKDASKFCTTVMDSYARPRLGSDKLTLLYRMSRDGKSAANFHSKVDDEGKTVTIIKSTTNHVFGGGTDLSRYKLTPVNRLNVVLERALLVRQSPPVPSQESPRSRSVCADPFLHPPPLPQYIS